MDGEKYYGMIQCKDIGAEHIDALKAIFTDKDVRGQFSSAPLASGRFERFLFSSADKFLLMQNENIVGVAALSRSGTRGFFGYALAPAFRGLGLAAECLGAIQLRARESGIQTLTTNIAAENTPSVRAATRAGFRPFRLFEKNIILTQ